MRPIIPGEHSPAASESWLAMLVVVHDDSSVMTHLFRPSRISAYMAISEYVDRRAA